MLPRWSSNLLALAVGAALVPSAACTGQARAPRRPPEERVEGPVVARYGDHVLPASRIEAHLAREPKRALELIARDPAAKRRFVEDELDRRILVAEAERRGLDRDPEVRAAFERALRKRVLDLELRELTKTATVTEAEVRAEYERRAPELNKPGQVRAAVIVRYAREPEAKVAAKALLARVEREVARRAPGARAASFAEAVAVLSQDPKTRRGGGELQFQTEAELARDYGAEAAATLARPGGFGELTLAETSTAVSLLLEVGERHPIHRALEDVRRELTAHVLREKRSRALTDRLAALRKAYAAEVDAAAVEKLKVPDPATAPAEAAEEEEE